jgi:hypothetical protein
LMEEVKDKVDSRYPQNFSCAFHAASTSEVGGRGTWPKESASWPSPDLYLHQ